MRRRGLETTQEYLSRRPEQERPLLLENQPIHTTFTTSTHPPLYSTLQRFISAELVSKG